MNKQFARVAAEWDSLSQEDPLWAILSVKDKEGGRWDVSEFFAMGKRDIKLYRQFIMEKGGPEHFSHVLDFGCGVGRLSQAWLDYSDRVTGIDIADNMIKLGKEFAKSREGIELLHNSRSDLTVLPSQSFDLVFSHICLQHMPFTLAQGYIKEFSRICRPGGWIVFQLPEPSGNSQKLARIRRWIVDHLPFRIGSVYRKWKHGRSTLFNMFFTSEGVVRVLGENLGLEILPPVKAAQAGILEGTLYFFKKH